MLVPSATCSCVQLGFASSPRRTSGALTLTTISRSKSPRVEVEIPVRRPREAVHAGVGAAAVGVDRPAERHHRALGDAVEDRPRPHLVEPYVEGLWGVETPHDRFVAVAGKAVLLLVCERQVGPSHTNVCSHTFRRMQGHIQRFDNPPIRVRAFGQVFRPGRASPSTHGSRTDRPPVPSGESVEGGPCRDRCRFTR